MARAALTGTRIRARRAQLGLKQAELARAIGVSPAYLNLIEHNRRPVSDRLLTALAGTLEIGAAALAEGAEPTLFEALREAAAGGGDGAESERIEEFAGRYPGWAALLAERQGRILALERTIEALTERLAHDPQLSASLHEVLSAVTSIRSTAAILAETEDIEPEWRARFHGNLRDDSERLADAAEALVGYLDAGTDRETGLSSPQEEFDAWLAAQEFHIAAAEAAAAPDPTVTAPELASSGSRALARGWLARARADAEALPMAAFLRGVEETAGDPGLLAARFGVPPLAVFRRLAGLPGAHATGLVLCDGAGALTFRKPVEGFTLPRFGAGCPIWPLYQALSRPGTAIRATLEMAGRVPRRFLAYAWCEAAYPAGFDGPQVLEAGMLLLPAEAARGPGELPVGATCRICPRADCPARREPSILTDAA
ncbi:DUF2083 domain-containing protein [Frigidibacter albus]|uniref:DUF2083 domain-containing protein n=1 Tax=Frigidibacter albus TaxID=1465486 RepID=A0A6L8VEE6_9RHOB|nr:XRE family transcriptional regulator [Frigidibacter albus]MZQ88121.1 DUF2083 domain-containing protein [Frigidibacter albus]NBE30205.1 DUF2083 domain-containing protein [Frigidibacter albus]GGH47346.1 XRE family transcriptional regulator [Frigidibacter albus]